MKEIKFFKDRSSLKPQDFKDIVSEFQFEKISPFKKLFNFGEKGEKFYVIIKGLLSVETKNPAIKHWYAERKYYLQLLDWRGEFEKKIEIAKKQRLELYQE